MDNEKENQEKILEQYAKETEVVNKEKKSKEDRIGPPITEVPETSMPWMREKHPLANTIGWIPIPIKDLPTQGLFYPPDTVVAVRSASGAENLPRIAGAAQSLGDHDHARYLRRR